MFSKTQLHLKEKPSSVKQTPQPSVQTYPINSATLPLPPGPSSPGLKPANLLTLQRLVGNKACQRLLSQAGPASERSLPQRSAAGDNQRNVMQRKPNTGEGHDLTSAELSGEPELEACFDGKGLLKQGKSGPAVEKLQAGLATLGFSSTDTSTVFGPGTRSAVIDFQTSAGMSGKDIDGIVGKRTLHALDLALRHGGVKADDDQAEADFKVSGKYANSAEEASRIFFDYNKAELDQEELDKIKKIATEHKETSVTLEGFASEEGSLQSNRRLVEQRIDAVSRALSAAKHQGLQLLEPRPEAGLGDVNYRRMRSVNIVRAGQAGTPKEKGCSKDKSKTSACPADLEKALKEAAGQAVDLINKTTEGLPLDKEPAQRPLFDRLFGTTDQTRPKTVVELRDILGRMRDHISNLPAPDNHKCGNECDSTCNAGAVAYNRDTQKEGEPEKENPAGVLTLCPNFNELDKRLHPILLLHEGHHGTPDKPSRDFAYEYERLIDKLDTETALKNASTIQAYIVQVAGGEALKKIDSPLVRIGPKKADQYSANLQEAKVERDALDLPLAWIEHWVHMLKFDISSAYTATREARANKKWPEGNGTRVMADFVAPRFRLARPPQIPQEKDQQAVAAIYDRVIVMRHPFYSPLDLKKIPTGAASWAPGPGAAVTVPQSFFSLDASQRVTVLLQELVHATENISANLEGEYVDLINALRIDRGWVGPKP